MNYKALAKRKLFERMYESLSDEDKRLYTQLTASERDHSEVMQAIRRVGDKVEFVKHSFASDLLANVSGNAVWDGALWLASRIIKKL